MDVKNKHDGLKEHGLEVIWVFGEDGSGEPYLPKTAQYFIGKTSVQFDVLMDDGFEKFMSAIDAGTNTLPQQFIIDPRNMELVDIVSGADGPAWEKIAELLELP